MSRYLNSILSFECVDMDLAEGRITEEEAARRREELEAVEEEEFAD